MDRILHGLLIGLTALTLTAAPVQAVAQTERAPRVERSVKRALDWLAREQRRRGYWQAKGGQYRVAMTALAGMALLCEGSTTTRGEYAENLRAAVDYLLDVARPNGLIGYEEDYRYTYGHGFSMLFLAQVYGEEEDADRRENLERVLKKAVVFSGNAQTSRGGWGYVSAADGNDFDEGSTCVTQVQGLRACRNAGIPVPKAIIDRAQKYIRDCTTPSGGVLYSIKRRGGTRPPITAAAVAVMFSTGEYESDHVKKMIDYCEEHIWPGEAQTRHFGHWHYAHYYYAQVMYRLGGEKWDDYYAYISDRLLRQQSADGAWKQGSVGPVYVTAINATILQLDNGYLPIYQR